jgi:hypothetical protein
MVSEDAMPSLGLSEMSCVFFLLTTLVFIIVCVGRYLRVLGSLWLWRWVRENESISRDIYSQPQKSMPDQKN